MSTEKTADMMKTVSESVFFKDGKNPKYNPRCVNCSEKCKQSFRVEIIRCHQKILEITR